MTELPQLPSSLNLLAFGDASAVSKLVSLRGMVMGALIGAANGASRIPQHLKEGLKARKPKRSERAIATRGHCC